MKKRKKNKNKKETDWFPKAVEASKELEAQRTADEIKYLVRRLYELIFKKGF